ncbi:MAG: tetratricopeptide repeat protein [Anaerolineales bacterium]|nr:tetratricopeptide repeat protein [Anaerolineales bacterium]
MSDDRILQEAIEAIENGQRARARDLLTRILRKEPARTDCWLYMSAVVETTKERTFCLENALKYDPKNTTALQGLVMLGKLPPDENITLIRPENERSREDIAIFEPASEEDDAASRRKKKRRAGTQVIPTVLVSLIALALIWTGIFGNPFSSNSGGLINVSGPVEPTSTFAPLAAAARDTPTASPTNTPEPQMTLSDVTLPTPLTIRVEEAYTPTPIYVDTPHPSNEAYSAAMSSFKYGNYEQALELFEQAREQMENNREGDLDVRYFIGLIYLDMGEYEDARREFELIIQDEPRFAPAYTAKSRAILAMRPDAIVAGDLYKAVNIDPRFIEGYLAVADYRLKRNEPVDVQAICEQLLKIEPDHPRGLHYLAEAYLALGENELALETARRAFELDMTMQDHYYTLGRALIENGFNQEGYGYMELYTRNMEEIEDRFVLYYLGRAFQGFDDHIRAIQHFEASYAIRRDLYEMSYYWANSLIAVGEYKDAVDRAIVPIEQTPNWFEPYVTHAQALYYLEDYDDAKEAIEAGADLAKTDEQLAVLYYWRGLIYEDLGYPLIAKQNWQKLLELSPSVVPVEFLREAQNRLLPAIPTYTPAQPTPTRVSDG